MLDPLMLCPICGERYMDWTPEKELAVKEELLVYNAFCHLFRKHDAAFMDLEEILLSRDNYPRVTAAMADNPDWPELLVLCHLEESL